MLKATRLPNHFQLHNSNKQYRYVRISTMKSVFYKKLMIGFIAILSNMAVNAKIETIEIGVLAKRGADTTIKRWTKLTQHLDKKVPGFTLVSCRLALLI